MVVILGFALAFFGGVVLILYRASEIAMRFPDNERPRDRERRLRHEEICSRIINR